MNFGNVKANRNLVFLLSIVLLAIAAALAAKALLPKAPVLSKEQIEKLREKYPLYENDPPNISMTIPGVEYIYKRADAVVFCEVTEILPEYYADLAQRNGMVKEPASSATFLQYKVKIREVVAGDIPGDTSGDKAGSDIIIVANAQLREYVPKLRPGMRIVTPVMAGSDQHEGKYHFSKYGFYYVTDDGYVLSAFVEDDKHAYTGRRLDYLKGKIKDLSGK